MFELEYFLLELLRRFMIESAGLGTNHFAQIGLSLLSRVDHLGAIDHSRGGRVELLALLLADNGGLGR